MLVGCTALLLARTSPACGRRPAAGPSGSSRGVAVLLVALVSPLDALGDTYLFSAHMIQHLLLLLVVPPLLILGIPAWLAERWLASPRIRRRRAGAAPSDAGAWPLGVGAI